MKYLALLSLAATMGAAEPNVSDQFYAAIRAGDAGAADVLIRSGAAVNTRDSRGGTPLFYAAVGTPEIMRLLITAGADVNARTAFGATPLTWSTADISKVRLCGGDLQRRIAGSGPCVHVRTFLHEHGSWYVLSRAPKIQPYFESGFPCGKDQWISQWATGWSTVALTLALPPIVAAR